MEMKLNYENLSGNGLEQEVKTNDGKFIKVQIEIET